MDKQTWIGIDIGKFHHSCSAPGKRPREFKSNTAGIRKMLHHCTQVAPASELFFVMEATSDYSNICALNLLELADTRVAIVPPACVNGFIKSKIKRLKNDNADAVAIREYAEVAQPAEWLPPSAQQQRLRDLQLVLEGVRKTIARKKCQQEKPDCAQEFDKFAWDSLQRSIESEQAEKQLLEKEIEAVIAADETMSQDSTNMLSVQGIGTGVRNVLMTRCYRQLKELSQRQMLAYGGMCPQENQSGKSRGRTRMNKAGDPRIRKIMYMAALSTIKPGRIFHDYFHQQKKKGKSGKSAMVSVMRKLLYLVQAVVKSNTPFDMEVYLKSA